jgi:putative copper export protein
VDFDLPHLSKWQGLAWWLGGLTFFATVFQVAKASAHPDNKISAAREFPEAATLSLGPNGKL